MPAYGRPVWVPAAVAGAVLVSACGSVPAGNPAPIGGSGGGGQPVSAAAERAEPMGADVDALVQGMTRFGVDVYRQVLAADEAGAGSNVVLSPASVAIAFGMARAGARDTTAEEIDLVLGFPTDPATTHASFNALDRALAEAAPAELPEQASQDRGATRSPEESSPPALAIANGVFPDTGFPIKEDYLATLAAEYGAGVNPIDFDDPERAKEILDAWVVDQTRGKITELFNQVDESIVLVLANAVYLKADWTHPFAELPTENLPFTLADGSQVQVPTMRQLDDFRVAQGDGWQAVELPYVGDRLAMRVIVPTGDGTPADVLDPVVLAAVGNGLTTKVVDLHLPSWDFDTTVELVSMLRALGMQAPFDKGIADFSGITERDIYISDAIHRATITVDEWGTEAAAVTGLGFAESAPAAPDVVVHADRPFAFVILDTVTGAPLFLGQVANPLR